MDAATGAVTATADAATAAHPPETTANGIKWSALCSVFDSLQQLHREGRKVKNKREAQEAYVFPKKLRQAIGAGESLFPYLRLFLPNLDTMSRQRYQIKEATIADLYITVYNIAPDSIDAKVLRNYKDPTQRRSAFRASSSASVGDFALVVKDVAKSRLTTDKMDTVAGKRVEKVSDWALKDVNAWLDSLAAAADNKARLTLFGAMIRALSSNEQMWLIRVILRDMKLGIKQDSVLGWYHPDAMEAYNSTLDLRKVCDDPALRDPSTRRKYTLNVMTGFHPMTADRYGMDDKRQDFLHGWSNFFVEKKLDGERMLVHKKGIGMAGSEVRMFSRQAIENVDYISAMRRYFIQAVPDVPEVILDGEVMSYDEELGEYLAFGSNMSAAKEMAANPTATRHLAFFAFDVVYVAGWTLHPELNGDITQLPLEKRKELLVELVSNPIPRFVEVLPTTHIVAATAAHRKETVLKEFEAAIDRCDEGLMLKKAFSLYEFGNRSSDWLKLKPEYAVGAHHLLDTIIIGGYYGDGTRRARDISHFLIGIIDETEVVPVAVETAALEGRKRKILSVRAFSKVGSGYNMEELSEILKSLKPHFVAVKKGDRGERPIFPSYIKGWRPTKRDDVPDVLLDDPNNALVVELLGAELIVTESFNANHTVRFPRVSRIRHDLPATSAITLDGIMEHIRTHGTRLAGKTVEQAYTDVHRERSSRRTAKKQRVNESGAAKFMTGYDWEDVNTVDVETDVLRGAEVYILPHPYDSDITLPEAFRSRGGIATLVKKLGGVPTPNRTVSTAFVIGSVEDIRTTRTVQGFVDKSGASFPPLDVLAPHWLAACYDMRAMAEVEPDMVVAITQKGEEMLSRVVDRYGEHHTRKGTVEELKRVLANVDLPPSVSDEPSTVAELFHEMDAHDLEEISTPALLFRMHKVGGTFKPCIGYFESALFPSESTASGAEDPQIASAWFRLYGGYVIHELSDEVTHVFVQGSDVDGVSRLRRTLARMRLPSVPILRPEWIEDCIQAGRCLDTAGYII